MLTLFHAPHSRSTRIVALLHELDATADVRIEPVTVPRPDGGGGSDPRNPHPEGKVPLLVHDGVAIWESTAIALHLTELFPGAGFGHAPGTPERGRLLSWLAWYGDVLEPVIVLQHAGLAHPVLQTTFRGPSEVSARLVDALGTAPWLVGDRYGVADLIVASAFRFAPDLLPDDPKVRDWLRRCDARPGQTAAARFDAELLSALSAAS